MMGTMVKAAVLSLVLSSCGGWHAQDTVLEAGFVAATALDWHQTLTITKYCNEINPIIGDCGQNVSLNVYFPVVIALHVLASAIIPRSWRPIWQGISIGGEGGTVLSNYREKYWINPNYTPIPSAPPLASPISLPPSQRFRLALPNLR